jgi:hypothetical protein
MSINYNGGIFSCCEKLLKPLAFITLWCCSNGAIMYILYIILKYNDEKSPLHDGAHILLINDCCKLNSNCGWEKKKVLSESIGEVDFYS